MTRRCSHCNQNGHNSRTCPNWGPKIFGVRLNDGSMRKSASTGNLENLVRSNGGGGAVDGYASEAEFPRGPTSSRFRERKKGVAWTEEEHKRFLAGLQKIGKGNWREISHNFVPSRTPTQVASHAQKYFIRQMNANRRKKRTSLFDMVPDEVVDDQSCTVGPQEPEAQSSNPVAALPPPPPAPPAEECEPTHSNSRDKETETAIPMPETIPYTYPALLFPGFYPYYPPVAFPCWPVCGPAAVENKAHQICKPMAVHPKPPANVTELASLSNLSLQEESTGGKCSALVTLDLLKGSERHSAFHASNRRASPSRMNLSSSPIHAV